MSAVRTKWQVIADGALIGLFLLGIWLPLAWTLVRPAANLDGAENRRLASMPVLKLRRVFLMEFPAKFEAFYKDQFGLRGTLIRCLSAARVQWLKISSCPNVILGKAGWLFYTPEPVGNDYDTIRPYTAAELDRWQRVLQARHDWLARRGIHYLFVVVPDKQTIYPELLPRNLHRGEGEESRLDQLLARLRARTGAATVDVRPRMRQAKTLGPLYYRTDTHWNSRGACAAYHEMVAGLAQWFPEMRPPPDDGFDCLCTDTAVGDLTGLLGLTDGVPERYLFLLPRTGRQAHVADTGLHVQAPPLMQPLATECSQSRLPRALMLRDSFAVDLVPFLSEHFSRILYVWQNEPTFDRSVVEKEHPQVVIQEMVERKLLTSVPAGRVQPAANPLGENTEDWNSCAETTDE